MTDSFTPGPWKWEGYSLRPVNLLPDTHSVHTILEVDSFAWGFLNSGLESTLREDAANRALIAVAPDLLAALRYALRYVPAGQERNQILDVIVKAVGGDHG